MRQASAATQECLGGFYIVFIYTIAEDTMMPINSKITD